MNYCFKYRQQGRMPLLWSLCFAAMLMFGCNEESSIGVDFFDDELVTFSVIDTLSLRVGTVMADSLATNLTDRILVGHHEDEISGKLSASAFFQLRIGESASLEEGTTIFDSLTLVLNYDGYYFYDTSHLQSFQVFRLTEDLEPDEDTGNFYIFDSFERELLPIGEKTFRPRPGKNEALEIRLSDDLGKELLKKIIDRDDELSSTEDFLDFFKGIAVVPDNTFNGAVVGFGLSSEMRLYYSDNSELPVMQETIVFPAQGAAYFTRIENDRSSTPLAILQTDEDFLNSQVSGSQSYIHAGVGLFTRIEIPFLNSLQEENEQFIISNARLRFYPILEQGESQDELPVLLNVLWADEENDVLAVNGRSAQLFKDLDFGRDTYYEVDITDFVLTQLETGEPDGLGLLLSLTSPPMNGGVHRISIGDGRNDQKEMELQLFLLDLNDEG
ncbi:MAG: DUF4270 family protein [Bacteroidota bacterium]